MIDTLITAISQKKNPTVLGLDPRPEYIPPDLLDRHLSQKGETLEALADAFLEFNKGLMDALRDVVPAVKPQCACYEALGVPGMAALYETIAYAKTCGLYVIADAKRGDIGSTAEMYAAAFLGKVRVGNTELSAFDADAVTVNPYLGSDNLNPFVDACAKYQKSIFVLCKTSNRSSYELQELPVGSRLLYRVVAEACERAGAGLIGAHGYSEVGIVAGATHPGHVRELRRVLHRTFFLVPGYGAQGADAAAAAAAFDKLGRGAIVNASRYLMAAWKASDGDYKDAAREAALAMKADLSKHVTIV